MIIRGKILAPAIALACTLGISSLAHAQYRDSDAPMAGQGTYRDGQPITLAPPPEAPSQSAVASARFRQAYARAGAPRIVVFWNKELDDEVASTYKERITADGRAVEERIINKRADLVAEPIEWEVERAFNRMLSTSGVRLVDRKAMMRLQGLADNAQRGVNYQAVETRALVGRVEIMIEVLQTEDKRLAEGISFRVTAKHVRNAEVLADIVSSGKPPARRMPLVAADVPGGFARAVQPDATPADIGRQLAVELMNSLAGNLR